MPWDRTRPAGTSPKYRTAEHRKLRARLLRELERDGRAECAQPVCVMPTRDVYPGDEVALGHDDTGEHYIGLVHKRCNDLDGSRRGSARSHGREPPAPTGRWVL